MAGALEGITVVEFSSNLPAAYTAMLLAEHGARAIRVSAPNQPALADTAHPQLFDRGKQPMLVDFDAPDATAHLQALFAAADIIVIGGSPMQQHKRGVDFEAVRRANPAAILISMPPFGSAGPLANMEGGEDLVAALAGITGSQWARSGNPVATIFPVVSYATAILSAISAVGALIARERTGLGQMVESPMIAGGLALQTGTVLKHPAMRPLHPSDDAQNPLGPIPCYRVFEASDGRYLFIACGNQTFWNRFTIAIERPELVADPRFEHAPWGLSTRNREALRQLLEPIIKRRSRAQWLEILRENDVPCAPIATRAEFFNDAQVRYMDACRKVRDAQLGETIQIGTVVRLSATPGGAETAINRGPSIPIEQHFRANPAPRLSPHAGAPAAKTPTSADAPPLEGVLVLDFSSYIAGSFCGMLLAQLGANVIKIESPQGDSFRSMEFAFMGWNQGKRSLAIDLTKAEGREIAARLAEQADIVLENMRPGRMHRFGLDYQTLAAKNPKLIYMTITGYGSRGPEYNSPGFDPLLQARSGMMAAQGGPHHPPVYLTCSPCDYGAAMLATFGNLLALYARNQSGRGQLCETSLLQAAIAFQAGELIFYKGRPNLEHGSPEYRGPSAASRAYRCRDDAWFFITVDNEVQWRSLLGLIGIDREITYNAAALESAEGPVAEHLALHFENFDRDRLIETLHGLGIRAVALNRVDDLFSDPQIAANHLLAELTDPDRGAVTQTGLLMKFGGTPGVLQRPAPKFGRHADEILRELLAMDSAQIDDLRRRRILVG
ncbi:MAG: CoA transferase [Candidatus Binataceae bacterium]|nr:CoA transferase [Candidatus Binataceae bacterium]